MTPGGTSSTTTADAKRSTRVVVFDLDDTLIDTSRVFHDIRESFIAYMVARTFDEARVRALLDRVEADNLLKFGYISERNLVSVRETYEALAEGSGVRFSSADLRRIAAIASKSLYAVPKPIPFARRLVPWVASRFRVALVTRGSAALQNAKVDALGIREHLELIQVVDRKTSDTFRRVAASLNSSPEHCVSIGDSMPFDIATALEAGMTAIHVIYPNPAIQWEHDKATGAASRAQHQVTSLREVKALLETLAPAEPEPRAISSQSIFG
jgi:putative hydrolase of the HAD superfamily